MYPSRGHSNINLAQTPPHLCVSIYGLRWSHPSWVAPHGYAVHLPLSVGRKYCVCPLCVASSSLPDASSSPPPCDPRMPWVFPSKDKRNIEIQGAASHKYSLKCLWWDSMQHLPWCYLVYEATSCCYFGHKVLLVFHHPGHSLFMLQGLLPLYFHVADLQQKKRRETPITPQLLRYFFHTQYVGMQSRKLSTLIFERHFL